METLEEVLAHYGVKGMHWGVRKARASGIGGPEPIRVVATPGKRIKTSGGKGHSPAQEAIDAAVSRQKSRKSSTSSLSNKELQDAIRRMQLEQQFNQLRAGTTRGATGKKFIKELLGVKTSLDQVATFNNSPSGKALKEKLNSKAA